MPQDISPKLRKSGESLRVSAPIAVNYPHDMPKGAVTRNLSQRTPLIIHIWFKFFGEL